MDIPKVQFFHSVADFSEVEQPQVPTTQVEPKTMGTPKVQLDNSVMDFPDIEQ